MWVLASYTRLSWPSHQLLNERSSTVLYRIVFSYVSPVNTQSVSNTDFSSKVLIFVEIFVTTTTTRPVAVYHTPMLPQRLQIAGNWLQNWPSTECLVSIFTVRINSKSFPRDVRSVQERYLFKFSATSNVRYCVLKSIRCSAASVWRPILKKADWIGNWK